jgi:uncharacterized protein YfaS (alpha-2-macroglobulin family)
MKKFAFFLSLFSLLFFWSCTDKKTENQDAVISKYIRNYTQQAISVTAPVEIELKEKLPQYTTDQKLPSAFLKIEPLIDGDLYIENGNRLRFIPTKKLQNNTTYLFSLQLGELYENLPKEEKEFHFKVATIVPDFRIGIQSIQSYNSDWQYISAEIEASDVLNLELMKQSVSAKQNDQELAIRFLTASDAKYFEIIVDSIYREDKDSEVLLSWNGNPVGAETKGSEAISIPGKDNFKVMDVRVAKAKKPYVAINFSEALDLNQDFLGLIQLGEETDLKFEVNGNILNVFTENSLNTSLDLKVFEGIKAEYGSILKTEFAKTIQFQQINPQVRLISKGVILPDSNSNPFYFETVNLAAVDVRIVQIYENNVLQFLQEQNMNSANSYNLRDVGRLVAKKTIPLAQDELNKANEWQAHAIDLSSVFEVSPGAIYQVEISFRSAYRFYDCGGNQDVDAEEIAKIAKEFEQKGEDEYWDKETWEYRNTTYNWRERDNPCHEAYYNEDVFARTNLLASNLGLLIKKTEKGSYFVATTNILTAAPEAQTSVRFYNQQQQLLGSLQTNGEGIAEFETTKKAAFVIAETKENFAYLKLENSNALSLSNFEAGGTKIRKGINAFMYTDRGVYRPGDDIYFNFVLDDAANPLPENHPVKLDFFDPEGRLTYTEVLNSSLNGFYHFTLSTDVEDPAGGWRVVVNVGAVRFIKFISIATVKPNRLKIKLSTTEEPQLITKEFNLNLSTEWLTGATAKNLKADVQAKFTSQKYGFKNFDKFNFSDPTRTFYPQELQVFEGKVNQKGEASFTSKISFSKKPPGMIKANFLSKVFEGGGDFSIDVDEQWYAPYTHFVGLGAVTEHQNYRFETDQSTQFEVVSVNFEDNIAANRKVKVYIYQIEWRWWWNRGRDQLSRYEDAEIHKAYKSFDLTTDASGKAKFSLEVPEDERGRFLVRVVDEESEHATGQVIYFFKDWWNIQQTSKEHNLVFTSDKKTYRVGEKAKINFPSMAAAKALLSVENGTEIIQHQWIDAQKGMTEVELEITEAMAPNAYLSISLLQQHQNTKNDLPIRLFGVIPIEVENPKRKLKPQLKLPESIRPESDYNLEVSEENGKAMTYTIAIVDEGLLDLTSFTTPAIYKHFNAKQTLGVRTFDVFDDVIGAYGGSIKNVYSIGGGDEAAGKKNRKAERFKPVVTHLGPFYLPAGKSKTHQLRMSNYIGSVKAMLVAGNTDEQSYGSIGKVMKVKQPLMLLTSIPRKLSPKEQVRIPVTIFVMDKQLKNIEVSVLNHDQLQLIGDEKQQLQVTETGEYMVYFDFKAGTDLASQKIKIQAKSGKEIAYNEVEIDIINPNPISSTVQKMELQNEEQKDMDLKPFGTPGTNAVNISFSAFPPINLEKRLSYLTSFPHGCVEQVTSKAFPQLFLKSIVELGDEQERDLEEQVQNTIKKLNKYQVISGGISYWQGGNPNSWTTNYVGHFMLEAKEKGYALPFGFISKWKAFQKEKARRWSASESESEFVQAYRLYTLALAGEAEVAAMNRLKNKSNLGTQARARLALSYAIIGQKTVANNLMKELSSTSVRTVNYRYTYGSVLRDLAMMLETYVYLKDEKMEKIAEEVAQLLSSAQWLHTHETAYALLAMSKYIAHKGGKELNFAFELNGKNTAVNSTKGIYQTSLKLSSMSAIPFSVKNNKEGSLFVNVLQSGQLPLGEELVSSRNIKVTTDYLDVNKEPIQIENLNQGTEVTLRIKVNNESNSYLNEVALSQFIPSGWEIIDTQFTDFKTGDFENANHVDLRDDRVYIYFDLGARKITYFEIKINASYLGNYYLPGTQVEAMYSGNHFARTAGKWINVVE